MDHEQTPESPRPAAAEETVRVRKWLWLPGWLRVIGFRSDPVVRERRSGAERRVTPFARRRHSFYCWLFGINKHSAFVDATADPPVPATSFEDDGRRTEVLLSLHNNIRDGIQRWEDRIFQAFMLSAGAVLSAVAFYLENRSGLGAHREIFGSAVGLFGVASLAYLYLAAKAHANNGVVLVKLEAALGLCQQGTYIRNESFFGYTGFWVEDWRTPTLLLIHSGVVVFSAYAILVY